MDPATRTAAEEKLTRMNDKIGYPIHWKSYDFEVRRASYADNAMVSDAFELSRTLRKVGKPLDRNEWQMTPPTVNAYYDPSLNEMVFPAGILQPPFFDKAFAPSVNYGATGAVMGHELTHGFDDEGSQFDGSGNLRNWWSEATSKSFKEQTQCVADQYGAYEALPGVKLNGKLTLGENIADIGGLKLAFSAFREVQKGEAERLVADGYTEDQVFFPRLRAVVVPEGAARVPRADHQDQPALAPAPPRQRGRRRHDGVRRGVLLQGRRADAPGQGLRSVVKGHQGEGA